MAAKVAGAGGSGGQLPPDFATKPVPKRVIEAITSSPQGMLYMLVHGEGRGSTGEAKGLALDRYDPVRAVVERVDLALDKLAGRPSLAASKDGLVLAAGAGDGGRYQVSWEALDAAAWEQVPGVEIGTQIEP